MYQREHGARKKNVYIFAVVRVGTSRWMHGAHSATCPLYFYPSGKFYGAYVSTVYVFIKTLHLCNVVLQFLMLNSFLETAEYPLFGAHVLYDLLLVRSECRRELHSGESDSTQFGGWHVYPGRDVRNAWRSMNSSDGITSRFDTRCFDESSLAFQASLVVENYLFLLLDDLCKNQGDPIARSLLSQRIYPSRTGHAVSASPALISNLSQSFRYCKMIR